MSVLTHHLPVLQVVLPLMAAPLCVILGHAGRAWWLSSIVSGLSLVIAAALLRQVLDEGVVSYDIGGWAAPWGIEYRVDALNALLLVLVSGASTLGLLFARDSLAREVAANRLALAYTSWMLCLTGLLGILVTGDAFNIFVFLEIASLSSYTLIALAQQPRALLAAFRYLVMGTVGATFFVIGVGLLYSMTGTLNLADMAERLPPVAHTLTAKAALGFIGAGLALKMALFPLHLWLPDAYARAPSAVTVLFAATSAKVSIYVLLRFVFGVFGVEYSFVSMEIGRLLLPATLLGVFVGSAVALYQDDVKRLFAWSSVAQVGYILLAVSTGSEAGLAAGVVHLFNHALMKAAIFVALGCIAYRIGPVTIDSIAGIGRHMPWTVAGLVAGGVSLVGVPLTAGFISKWYLLVALLERGWWPVAVLVVVTSLMAAGYVWRVVESACLREAPAGSMQSRVREAPWLMLLVLWLLVAANLYFGLETSLTAGTAQVVARTLFGAGG